MNYNLFFISAACIATTSTIFITTLAGNSTAANERISSVSALDKALNFAHEFFTIHKKELSSYKAADQERIKKIVEKTIHPFVTQARKKSTPGIDAKQLHDAIFDALSQEFSDLQKSIPAHQITKKIDAQVNEMFTQRGFEHKKLPTILKGEYAQRHDLVTAKLEKIMAIHNRSYVSSAELDDALKNVMEAFADRAKLVMIGKLFQEMLSQIDLSQKDVPGSKLTLKQKGTEKLQQLQRMAKAKK